MAREATVVAEGAAVVAREATVVAEGAAVVAREATIVAGGAAVVAGGATALAWGAGGNGVHRAVGAGAFALGGFGVGGLRDAPTLRIGSWV
ncbi:hypothetical protein [Micromonospora sp. NPDC050495]|uniref:hypothetical protein n=1 Tax=Micromonospora sp. NPDC050495 TaxID=3154936 RepID=UPI0033DFE8DD